MADGDFAAAVRGFVEETKADLLAIVRTSVQDLVDEMKTPKAAGGNMPIDTSFLQNSLAVSSAAIPSIDPSHDASQPPMTGNAAAIQAAIADMQLGDTLHFGFTAVYALRQNYGFTGWDSLGRYYNQAGNLFVEKAVQNWQSIVSRNAARLSSMSAFSR